MEEKPCSNPGCDQPGISCCSACKTSFYCGPICQAANWPKHKEECDGHLRKVGKANLIKADGFHQQRNWTQTLRYCEIAATKLKQLKDRRLETVQLIDDALTKKFDALTFMDRQKEALECIQECYTLWAMNHLRNPGSMNAALGLIQSCIHNKEYEDAERYARHAYFMIAEMTDNFIPSDQQPEFLADVSFWLSRAIFHLAQDGGIPPEEQQKAGEEAITHARKALEFRTQVHGTESAEAASSMGVLADVLNHFNDVDDDEVLRLYEQAIAIYRRVEGSSTVNVGCGENKLANVYVCRAERASIANDLDRELANLELALPHYREAIRIYRAINQMDHANAFLRRMVIVEDRMQRMQALKRQQQQQQRANAK